MQLRTVAAATPCFNKIDPVPSFTEALNHLSSSKCDVVFIGDLPIQDAKEFVDKARTTGYGKLAAFIFLRPQRSQNEGAAAVDVIAGADGILYAPYSVDNVTETTKIADAIREADAEARRKAAMTMLLGSVMSEVDQLGEASQKPGDSEDKPTFAKIRQLGEQLKQATKTAAVDYLGTLSKAFLEAKPPADKSNRLGYGGVSARVQRIIDRQKSKDGQ